MNKFTEFLRSIFGPKTVEITWESAASEIAARVEPEPVKFEKPLPNSATTPTIKKPTPKSTTIKPKSPVKTIPKTADKPKKKSYYKPKVKA